MAKSNVSFMSNLDGLSEITGAVEGMFESLDDDYLDSLILEAHRETSDEFDLEAAATGMAGLFTHMFEFGVPGITRGPARHADPAAPSARLWTHEIVGGGGVFDVDFMFRPALTPNPQPTTRDTGVPSKYLRKLSRRKYVFHNKAMVTETGMEVEIRPKNGNLLFVPFYGEQSHNPLNKRGFAMVPGPIRTRPGASSAGQFTAFWNGWWTREGIPQMQEFIEMKVRMDSEEWMRQAQERAEMHPIKPAVATKSRKVATDSANKVQSVAVKKSRQRRSRKKRR